MEELIKCVKIEKLKLHYKQLCKAVGIVKSDGIVMYNPSKIVHFSMFTQKLSSLIFCFKKKIYKICEK